MIKVQMQKLDYLEISVNNPEQRKERTDAYLKSGWDLYAPPAPLEDNKVRLVKLNYELKKVITTNPIGLAIAHMELEEKGWKLILKRYSNDGYEAIFEKPLSYRPKDDIIDIIRGVVNGSFKKIDDQYQSIKESKVFDKPDQIKEDFVSDDEHLKDKSKYIYFEDTDSAEVTQWANEKFKEGYKLIGGIEPKQFLTNSNVYYYHATMVYDETV